MLPMMLAAGGLSLAQGLFARSDSKKATKAQNAAAERAYQAALAEAQRARAEAAAVQNRNFDAVEQTNRTNAALGQQYREEKFLHLDHLVADAERAGFNPLSVLRAGGAALYSKQVNLPGYQMMMPSTFQWSELPGLPTRSAQSVSSAPGVGSLLAGAANDAFGHFMSETRLLGQQNFQRELLQMSLAGVAKGKKAGNTTAGSSFYVPGYLTAGQAAKVAALPALARPQQPEAGKVEVTNPFDYRGVDPTSRDASTFTGRYGESELVEMVTGTKTFFDDIFFNLTGMTGPQRFKMFFGSGVKRAPLPELGNPYGYAFGS